MLRNAVNACAIVHPAGLDELAELVLHSQQLKHLLFFIGDSELTMYFSAWGSVHYFSELFQRMLCHVLTTASDYT